MSAIVPLSEKLSFTPAELAKATGLGRGAAYRVARQIGRRFGRRIFVAREAVDRWLRDREPVVPSRKRSAGGR